MVAIHVPIIHRLWATSITHRITATHYILAIGRVPYMLLLQCHFPNKYSPGDTHSCHELYLKMELEEPARHTQQRRTVQTRDRIEPQEHLRRKERPIKSIIATRELWSNIGIVIAFAKQIYSSFPAYSKTCMSSSYHQTSSAVTATATPIKSACCP